MVQAVLGSAAGLLGNQTRRTFERPAMPSVALAMSQGKTPKESKALAKAAREDRLLYLLSQPEVIGLLITLAGIYASQNIPFSDNEVTNEGLQAISTMSSVLIGLGYAGVGDLTTLLAGAVAAGFSLSDFLFSGADLPNQKFDWKDFLPWPFTIAGYLS